MPWAPKRPCTYPGCPELTVDGRCEAHRRQERQEIDERRGTAASRGYGARWRKAREAFLRQHPLCAECHASGRFAAATVVDHIRPHKGDRRLFWDRSNWQALCRECHDRKTAGEGRWGDEAGVVREGGGS